MPRSRSRPVVPADAEGELKEPWRELRVGDRIRIIQLPSARSLQGIRLHRDTRQLYRRLIARKRPLAIYEIDKDGLPWIMCRFLRKTGGNEIHFLAINDDSWVRVKSRAKRKR